MLERLRELRRYLELNQTDFAKKLGLTQTAYSMIENGNRPLSQKHIKVICSEFGISENWICNGNGDMFTKSPHEKELLNIFESLTTDSQEYLITMAKELLKTETKLLNQ